MPIYEYRCTKGHTFELMQPIHDDAIDKCQVCGAPAERVLYAPAVHFKGSGFYNTDYGTKKRSREMKAAAESGADKHDAKSAEKKDSAKSDSGGGDSKSSASGDSGGGSSSSGDSGGSSAKSEKPAAPAKSD